MIKIFEFNWFTFNCSIYSLLTSFKPNRSGMIITNGFQLFCISLDFFIKFGIWHILPLKRKHFFVMRKNVREKKNERISSRTWTFLSNSLEAIRLKYKIQLHIFNDEYLLPKYLCNSIWTKPLSDSFSFWISHLN